MFERHVVSAARTLIVGASGFIGRRLYESLGPGRAVATYLNRTLPGGVRFDPLSMRLAHSVLRTHGPFSHAFVLYSMTNIDACAREPGLARSINVDSQMQVVSDLVAHGVVPVFASSDAVFDGHDAPYGDEAPVAPQLTYGRHKAEMEAYMRTLDAPWLTVRLAKVLDARPGSGDMLDAWAGQIERGEPIRCAHDQVFSPIDVADVVHALLGLCERGCSGLYNLCGPHWLRRLDLLHLLIDALGRRRVLRPVIETCSLHDFPFVEARPLDTSMRSDKLERALGWSAQGMADVCERAASARYGPASAPTSTSTSRQA